MSISSIEVTFNDIQLRQLFKEFPKIANQSVNRAYKRSIKAFSVEFAKTRLVKGVYKVKRKASAKTKAKHAKAGQVVIAAKAQAAGFRGKIGNLNKLKGKWISCYTRNPLLVMRELGLPAVAKKTIGKDKRPYLYIHGDVKKAFGRTKAGKARRERFEKSKAHLRRKDDRWKKPIVAKVPRVGPFPRLGFVRAWKAYQPTLIKYLRKTITGEVVRRATIAMNKRRAA